MLITGSVVVLLASCGEPGASETIGEGVGNGDVLAVGTPLGISADFELVCLGDQVVRGAGIDAASDTEQGVVALALDRWDRGGGLDP